MGCPPADSSAWANRQGLSVVEEGRRAGGPMGSSSGGRLDVGELPGPERGRGGASWWPDGVSSGGWLGMGGRDAAVLAVWIERSDAGCGLTDRESTVRRRWPIGSASARQRPQASRHGEPAAELPRRCARLEALSPVDSWRLSVARAEEIPARRASLWGRSTRRSSAGSNLGSRAAISIVRPVRDPAHRSEPLLASIVECEPAFMGRQRGSVSSVEPGVQRCPCEPRLSVARGTFRPSHFRPASGVVSGVPGQTQRPVALLAIPMSERARWESFARLRSMANCRAGGHGLELPRPRGFLAIVGASPRSLMAFSDALASRD